MTQVKTAVIGVGYLGKFHAQKYAQHPDAELVAVCDSNINVANQIAEDLHTQATNDYQSILDQVDAVSIVVPTQLHYDVARECLAQGKHVLLEKPMTSTVDQARELVQLSHANNRKLQIGHLERFNPAIIALSDVLQQPLFIESHRVAPFNPRGADVNVVLDLMIHDIDIIMEIVDSDVKLVSANGVSALSRDIDIANARIEFENGCIANVTASRASLKSERKMRIFQHDAYISVDFQNKTLGIYRKGSDEMFPGIPNIEKEELAFEQGDALASEIDAFLHAIQHDTIPVVSGEAGLRALIAAEQISQLLTKKASL